PVRNALKRYAGGLWAGGAEDPACRVGGLEWHDAEHAHAPRPGGRIGRRPIHVATTGATAYVPADAAVVGCADLVGVRPDVRRAQEHLHQGVPSVALLGVVTDGAVRP